MSHAHIDHCGGCMTDDSKRHFPNAQYYITQADYDFWTTESNIPKDLKVFWETALKNLTPNEDRMVFIKDRAGVTARHPGDPGAGPHRWTHDLHDLFGRQAALLHRRSHPPPGVGEAADRVRLRHRPETVGPDSRQDAQHAGGEPHSDPRLPFRLARHRARGKAG